ncbi:hypothetical protein SGCOL_011075 [Colletotrichum sp. CLE4]
MAFLLMNLAGVPFGAACIGAALGNVLAQTVDLTGNSKTTAGPSSTSTTPNVVTTPKAVTTSKADTSETPKKGRQTRRSRQAGTDIPEEAYSTPKEMAHMKPWYLY